MEQPLLHSHNIITGVWAAFLVMVIAEVALLYVPGLPQHDGIIAIVVAFVAG